MLAKVYMNTLLDYYGGLLTKKQQAICRYYYQQDLSYQEIASIEKISRSAVYDTVKRCKQECEQYEKTLHLMKNAQMRKKLYARLLPNCNAKGKKLIEACEKTEVEGGLYE